MGGKAKLGDGEQAPLHCLSTWIQPCLKWVSHWQVKELGLMQLCWSDLNYKYKKELQCSRRVHVCLSAL